MPPSNHLAQRPAPTVTRSQVDAEDCEVHRPDLLRRGIALHRQLHPEVATALGSLTRTPSASVNSGFR